MADGPARRSPIVFHPRAIIRIAAAPGALGVETIVFAMSGTRPWEEVLFGRPRGSLARAKCYMAAPALANLLKLVGTARDGAALRFSLGSEYLKAGDPASAIEHLSEAVARDPNYSAAWKLLGKACADAGRLEESLGAYERGIVVAEARGDKQAAKEMTVFARRVRKQLGDAA